MAGARIAILKAAVVPDDFDARFSATGRHYLYRILNRRAPLGAGKGQGLVGAEAARCRTPCTRRRKLLLGRHDFTTFRSTQCQANSPVRTLDRLDVSRQGDLIEVRASARSFLHNQVRSMVGSLKRVGDGGWTRRRPQGSARRARPRRLRPGGAARRAFPDRRRLSADVRRSPVGSTSVSVQKDQLSMLVGMVMPSSACSPNNTASDATNMPANTAVPTAAPLPIDGVGHPPGQHHRQRKQNQRHQPRDFVGRRQEKPDQRRRQHQPGDDRRCPVAGDDIVDEAAANAEARRDQRQARPAAAPRSRCRRSPGAEAC